MLRNTNALYGAAIEATDGSIGTVDQLLFDDQKWTVRYLVADTGGWLTGRLVLISPIAVSAVDWQGSRVEVVLTKEQVERSPDISSDEPVSRQKEHELFQYYRYPIYWGGPGLWGAGMAPGYFGAPGALAGAAAFELAQDEQREAEEQGDPHLRSTRAVVGYTIQARDATIGHVEDFVIDDETWAIRYMVVDTRDWWPGKKVLVAPPWIAEISWTGARVYVDLPSATIENAPEYDAAMPIDREYESRLHAHYGRPMYWES